MAKAPIAVGRRGFVAGCAALVVPIGRGTRAQPGDPPAELTQWLRIEPDGSVVIRANCVEMGQGSPTGFAQIVADELDLPWDQVRVELAPIEPRFYNLFKSYSTGGSASIQHSFQQLRQAGASARSMLRQAAANLWRVPVGQCVAEDGRVHHPASGRNAAYGALAARAAALPVPANAPLKAAPDWRYIGRSIERPDIPSKCNGTAEYGIDVQLPGLLVAAIAHCPQFGGKLASVDQRPALAIQGVRAVVPLESAVAVVATGYWEAQRGLNALSPEWTRGVMAGIDSAGIAATLQDKARQAQRSSLPPAEADALRARVDDALRSASRRVDASYFVPLLSQSPMEPMNATAWVHAGGAELWVPTQAQSAMQEGVGSALGIPPARVRVVTTQIGGGFGRRLDVDYGIEAALISRAVQAPVKLIWSRKEDTQHARYRPASHASLSAGLDDSGKPTAFRAAFGTMEDDLAGMLFMNLYDLGPAIALDQTWKPGVPLGSWRGVAANAMLFFLETFVDELAAAVGSDPVAYRRRLLADERARRVMDRLCDVAGWGHCPQGHFQGIALTGRTWNNWTGQVVELSVSPAREIRLHRITCVTDCGTVVNPGQARAQAEGGILFGLSAAMWQDITIDDGQVEQSSFADFPVAHLRHTPPIDVHFIGGQGASPGGVGEAPVVPFAPAFCNALFAATGVRIRQLPVRRAGFTMA